MKTINSLIFMLVILSNNLFSQEIEFNKNNLTPVGASMSIEKYAEKNTVKVIKDANIKDADQPTFVKLTNVEFKNGVIELNVLSKLTANADKNARGFIGVAFRINSDNSKFECIYLRPTNARCEDPARRSHTIQYFSFPSYPFWKLRQESPNKYESFADMGLNEWVHLKIVVQGSNASLYVNNSSQPCLVVNDLKLGENLAGSIGLWVDNGTEGYFSGLTVKPEKK
jgi:hypothetical protein